MRIDLRCWARAVYQLKAIWGFKGIAKPRRATLVLFDPKKSFHAQIVLCDDRFTDRLCEAEADYIATSDDWFDDWREYVERTLHVHGCCPHGAPEEKERYNEDVDRMVNSASERRTWAGERVDSDWVRDTVEQYFDDEESIYYFLKDHPVDVVWCANKERWLNLTDVHGYCGSCNEPLTEEDLLKVDRGTPHAFDRDCEDAACRNMMFCLFDREARPRRVYECPACSWGDTVDDIANDETFVSKHGRPFDWPPGAPYPPRRSFSGYPMEAPPYED